MSFQHSLKAGFAEEGLCYHDFMKVCVEWVRMSHSQGQRVSFWLGITCQRYIGLRGGGCVERTEEQNLARISQTEKTADAPD